MTAADFLRKAQADVASFYSSGDLFILFNALCTLNHLREWLCPDLKRRWQAPDWPANPAEALCEKLWSSPDRH